MMSSTDAWLAIVNPVSGPRLRRGSWAAIEQALRAAGVSLEVEYTKQPYDGIEMARRAVLEGRRRLIVAGGDGSVNDVLNGLMEAGLEDTRDVTLAVAPTGTGNDWARFLGIDRDPATIAAAIAAGRTILHDVGLIAGSAVTRFSRRDGSLATEQIVGRYWFINVAGAGYDAYVSARVPRPMPSALTYFGIVLRGLLAYRPPHFRIEANGTRIEGRMFVTFAANASHCGNRMHVAPGAIADDGLLDVVAIREVGFLRALPKIVKLYAGTILDDPGTRHVRCERLRVDTDPPVEIQADGQMAGHTPAEFSLLPRALRVVVRPGEPSSTALAGGSGGAAP
jgi:diacylglycerol kinase (ATP)